MGIYRYIFFTILSVYKKFSRDPQIWIFAFGFFNLIIAMCFISVWGIYKYYVLQKYSSNYYVWLAIAGTIIVFNIFHLVLDSKKQEEYYDSFMKMKTKLGNLLVGAFIILAFILTIWVATKHREKNLEKKQQTTEITTKARVMK